MRQGVDPKTGKWLSGWEHCVSCLAMLFATRISTVPWRRLYGATIKDVQDQNANPDTILGFYTSVADAVDKFEPGFRLKTIEMLKAGRDGRFIILITGLFYPNGHLGDYSIVEDRSTDFARTIFTPGIVEAL